MNLVYKFVFTKKHIKRGKYLLDREILPFYRLFMNDIA